MFGERFDNLGVHRSRTPCTATTVFLMQYMILPLYVLISCLLCACGAATTRTACARLTGAHQSDQRVSSAFPSMQPVVKLHLSNQLMLRLRYEPTSAPRESDAGCCAQVLLSACPSWPIATSAGFTRACDQCQEMKCPDDGRANLYPDVLARAEMCQAPARTGATWITRATTQTSESDFLLVFSFRLLMR